MIINKLKAISIAIFCFVISLYSEAQGMDNPNDILESATVNRTANIQSVSQNEVNDLDLISPFAQIINNEDSEASWASYLISPVKTTLQMANEFISLAHHNPNKAILVGLVFTYQIASVAAKYQCVFTCAGLGGNSTYPSEYPTYDACMKYVPCTLDICVKYRQCGIFRCEAANCFNF